MRLCRYRAKADSFVKDSKYLADIEYKARSEIHTYIAKTHCAL